MSIQEVVVTPSVVVGADVEVVVGVMALVVVFGSVRISVKK